MAIVDRLPVWDGYPRLEWPVWLFSLAPGKIARYRANFRMTGCCCSSYWFYERTAGASSAPDR